MGMCFHLLFHLSAAKHVVGHAGGCTVALFDGVHQAEVHGVDSQFFRQFIYHRFYGESALRLARRSVCLNLLLVANDVVAVHQQVFDIVRPSGRHCSTADGGTGEGPGFIGHVQLGCCYLPALGGPNLAPNVGGRRRTSAFKYLFSGHHYFHRASALLGQYCGHRL